MGSKLRKKAVQLSAPQPAMDRRAMESTMADVHRLLQRQEFDSFDDLNAFLERTPLDQLHQEPETPAERAQDVMYKAFAARGKKRILLAKEALTIDVDCADAYVLLAEEEDATDAEVIRLYELAVAAGKKNLAKIGLEELEGSYWGRLETRPYMRARAGLGHTLWAVGRCDEAASHFQDLLRLNPNDNQGVRYSLLPWLLTLERSDEARALLDEYPDDGMAVWEYANSLLVYRTEGPGEAAVTALLNAFAANPFVPAVVLTNPLPEEPPTYGLGDTDEAIVTVYMLMETWVKNQEYLEWMLDTLSDLLELSKKTGRTPRRRKAVVSRL